MNTYPDINLILHNFTQGTGKALTDAGVPSAVGDTDAKAGDVAKAGLFDTARKRGVLIDTFNKAGAGKDMMSGSDTLVSREYSSK